MNDDPVKLGHPLWGRLLFLLQIMLMAYMIWPRGIASFGPAGVSLCVLAAVIGFWTLAANRPGNFSVFPEPKTGAQLITSGPYPYVRHPMYTSVLLFCAGMVVLRFTLIGVISWSLLVAVLYLKSRLEEAALRQKFPAYGDYRLGTGRFLPWPKGRSASQPDAGKKSP